jgi:hypothetical protein
MGRVRGCIRWGETDAPAPGLWRAAATAPGSRETLASESRTLLDLQTLQMPGQSGKPLVSQQLLLK